jgi:hypothetical protein
MPQTQETESLDALAESLDTTPYPPDNTAERTMPNQVLAYVKNAENSTTKWHLSYGAL